MTMAFVLQVKRPVLCPLVQVSSCITSDLRSCSLVLRWHKVLIIDLTARIPESCKLHSVRFEILVPRWWPLRHFILTPPPS